MDELPEPGALLPVKESEIDQGAQGSPYSQEPSRGEVGSWNPEDPTFKFDKVDGRKEDKSPGQEEVVHLAPLPSKEGKGDSVEDEGDDEEKGNPTI